MGRFLPAAERVTLGACACPGTPHPEGDWFEIRPAPWSSIFDASEAVLLSERFFGIAMATITGWNLLNDEGEAVPVSIAALDALDAETFGIVRAAVEAAIPDALPNASGAPSRRSRPGSAASPTPTTGTP